MTNNHTQAERLYKTQKQGFNLNQNYQINSQIKKKTSEPVVQSDTNFKRTMS